MICRFCGSGSRSVDRLLWVDCLVTLLPHDSLAGEEPAGDVWGGWSGRVLGSFGGGFWRVTSGCHGPEIVVERLFFADSYKLLCSGVGGGLKVVRGNDRSERRSNFSAKVCGKANRSGRR